MKKTTIKKICFFVILILIVLLIISAFRYRPIPAPTFNFLSGRAITAQYDKDQSFYKSTYYIYSFEADYDSFISEAGSELLALGYKLMPPSAQSHSLEYILNAKKSGDSISVSLRKYHKMNIYSTPKDSDYETSTRYEYGWKEGWISVEIIQRKKQNRFIIMAKQLLNKFQDSE